MNNDTIAAIATPPGTGGIAIVKISGPKALTIAGLVFRPANPKRFLSKMTSQTMIYGHIHDAGSGDTIDEVLVAVLKGPHSFTGEDVVEINCHGGQQVSRNILELLLDRGIRLAEPGEFTRRAFMNGRIDLTQAEATIDLIHAQTRRAARMGSRMLKDGLGSKIRALIEIVDENRMRIEADIEFGEEADMEISPQEIQEVLRRAILPVVDQLVADYQQGAWIRDGLRVVLTGKPNVGKSSLMNRLLQMERVIVTEVAGTTRDTIEERFEIEGVPILLTDAAGLRPSSDPIEHIGQEKAWQAVRQADLILFLIDGSQPVDELDRDLAGRLEGLPYVVIRNKSDLVTDPDQRSVLENPPSEGYFDVSALTGDGLAQLKAKMLTHAQGGRTVENDAWLPSRRQNDILMKIQSLLSNAMGPCQTLDTLAMDLRDCGRYFNQILGVDIEPDVLDSIFKRFCIGK